MKKIILSIFAAFAMFVMLPNVNAEEKVPVYMFTKNGCPACDSAHEYFTDLAEKHSDLFDLYIIEVFDGNWNIVSKDLGELLTKVYDKYGEDSSKASTPTIVIGEYHTLGLPQDTNIVLKEIEKARDSENKVDEVKKIADTLKIDLEQYKLVPETPGKYDAIIIVGIFVVLIGGFAALVYAGKK